MSQRTCPVCSDPVPESSGPGRPRIFCSRRCSRWHANHMSDKTCTESGCSRPQRARGACSAHYMKSHRPPRRKVEVPCANCGQVVEKYSDSSRRPTCSLECRRFLQFGPKRPKKARLTEAPTTTVKGSSFVWVVGTCDWCGESFTKPRLGTVSNRCSTDCVKAAAKARQRESKGRFQASPARRRRLYERDNWTCQICAEPIDREAHYMDPWAPSLDHIVPQSHTLIPDHSDENLRTAHRWCNSVRGDLSHYTDADLIGAA